MKSYTDIEQSKQLAEILPIESADMAWYSSYAKDGYSIRMLNDTYLLDMIGDEYDEIHAWSLAALMDLMPTCVLSVLNKTDGNLYRIIKDTDERKETKFHCNSIAAAVEMILKLREKDLL